MYSVDIIIVLICIFVTLKILAQCTTIKKLHGDKCLVHRLLGSMLRSTQEAHKEGLEEQAGRDLANWGDGGDGGGAATRLIVYVILRMSPTQTTNNNSKYYNQQHNQGTTAAKKGRHGTERGRGKR